MKRACDTEVQPAARSLVNRYAGTTVLAIGAHPDDLEIGIGGTLAKLQKNGANVVMCVASIPKDYEVRLEEATEGARILGCELKILMEGGPRRIEDIKTCELVGLVDQANKLPMSTSGGQQQRAAIARSLANDPPLIVADEPTGNLDTVTSEAIFRLFGELRDDGKTVVIVTHERDAITGAGRTVTIVDGCVAEDRAARSA